MGATKFKLDCLTNDSDRPTVFGVVRRSRDEWSDARPWRGHLAGGWGAAVRGSALIYLRAARCGEDEADEVKKVRRVVEGMSGESRPLDLR